MFCVVKLVHEDTDISDMSVKCLSLIVQLYGAEETSGSLTVAHLVSYAHIYTVTVFIHIYRVFIGE